MEIGQKASTTVWGSSTPNKDTAIKVSGKTTCSMDLEKRFGQMGVHLKGTSSSLRSTVMECLYGRIRRYTRESSRII